MTYLAPRSLPPSAPIKNCLRLLLPLPLCALLIGCDSQSANAPFLFEQTSAQTQDEDENNTSANKADIEATESDAAAVVADDVDYGDEGESLLAVAQTDDQDHAQPVPMIAEPDDQSSLQATLIGDYMGMVPCDFCDSIEVTLNLFADGSVEKTSIYNKTQMQQAPSLESGIYRQDDRIITIVYEDQHIESYHINANHLVMIDDNDVPNSDYTLARK